MSSNAQLILLSFHCLLLDGAIHTSGPVSVHGERVVALVVQRIMFVEGRGASVIKLCMATP